MARGHGFFNTAGAAYRRSRRRTRLEKVLASYEKHLGAPSTAGAR